MGSCFSKSKKGDASLSHNASTGKVARDVVPAQFLSTSRVQSCTEVSNNESSPGLVEATKNNLAESLRHRKPPNARLLSDSANTSTALAKDPSRQHVEQHFPAESRKISSLCADSAAVSASEDHTRCNTPSVYSPEMGREVVSHGSAATDKFLALPIPSDKPPALASESLNSNKSQNSESFNSLANVSNGEKKENLHSLTRQQEKATELPTNIMGATGGVRASGGSLRDPTREDDPPGHNEHIISTPVSTNYNSSVSETDITPKLIGNASSNQTVADTVLNVKPMMKSGRSSSPEHNCQPGGLLSSSKTKKLDDFKECLVAEGKTQALFLDGQTDSERFKTSGDTKDKMKLDSMNFNKFQPANISNREKEEQQGKNGEVSGGRNETMEHFNRILGTGCTAINHERQFFSQGYEKSSQHRQTSIFSSEEPSCRKRDYQIEKSSGVSISAAYGDKLIELEKEEAKKIETAYELEKHVASNSFEFTLKTRELGNLEILTESLGKRSHENTLECIFNRAQEEKNLVDMEAKTIDEQHLDNESLKTEVIIQDKLMRVPSSGTQKDSTSATDIAQPSDALLFEPDLVESDSETFEFKQAVSLFPAENLESHSKEDFVTLGAEKRDGASLSSGQTELASADRKRTWDVFDMKGSPLKSNKFMESSSLNDYSLSKESLAAIQTISYDSHEWDLQSHLQHRIRDTDGRLGTIRQLSVVSTGDALLFSGSNPDEFHLIPSKSLVVDLPSSIRPMIAQLSQEDSYLMSNALCSEYQQEVPPSALTIDDIILLLENDELDEEDLISLLINAKSSCQASDVASESSFEFKVRSTGSTPHSTPSTPMLSAGSTPRRMSQLNSIALTPEEIAEIWGVFESRQALPSY